MTHVVLRQYSKTNIMRSHKFTLSIDYNVHIIVYRSSPPTTHAWFYLEKYSMVLNVLYEGDIYKLVNDF